MRGSSLYIAVVILLASVTLFFFALTTIAPEGRSDVPAETLVEPLDSPTVDFGNPMIGPLNAPVRIVEFGDYQCESCAEFSETVSAILVQYGNLINYVWKDAPDVSAHAYAMSAASAARCAGDQGAYWNYHELMFSNQAAVNDNSYPAFAQQIGLDIENFTECTSDRRMEPLVLRDREQAVLLGIDATPYLFVNDVRISGAPTVDRLRSIIDAELIKDGITPPEPPAANPATEPEETP